MIKYSGLKDFFIWAVLVAVIAGVLSYILGFIFGPIQTMMYGQIIAGFLVFFFLIYLAGFTDVDHLSIFQLLLVLILVGTIGSLIVTIFPPAAAFILVVGAGFTWLGLGFTLIYIMLADILIEKYKPHAREK